MQRVWKEGKNYAKAELQLQESVFRSRQTSEQTDRQENQHGNDVKGSERVLRLPARHSVAPLNSQSCRATF